eukprot:TRINITY_DN71552_c0_g1_i1.p1 TRINITY_DN71552_c0_g1~~TRINITY_DN71552_c0_g1_i1.p1  ORF type:complete len:476 (+),score=110.78 TRINITY_DN71552_c0_g1_i1:139-1566(+)
MASTMANALPPGGTQRSPFDQLFDAIDANGNGVVSKEEFLAAMARGVMPVTPPVSTPADAESATQFVQGADLHQHFDFSRDGRVTRKEVMRGLRYLQQGGPVGSLVFGRDSHPTPLPPDAIAALGAAGYSGAADAAADAAAKAARARGYGARGVGGVGGGPGFSGPGFSSGAGAGAFGGGDGGMNYATEVDAVGTTEDGIRTRPVIRVPLRKPKYPGGKEFYGDVPVEAATFAHAELCATPEPEASLAPMPEVGCKMWYNTYLYVPEDRRAIQSGGHFLERFVQGENGEWLDVPKARRMAEHVADMRQRDAQQRAEEQAIRNGSAWSWSGSGNGENAGGVGASEYRDPYSGETLVMYKGELLPKAELFAQHGIQESEWRSMFQLPHVDFDNFRVPWPFGRPHRNKRVSNSAYEWFDRQNPFIPSDRSYEMLELPSTFVDKENYGKWRATGGDGPMEFASDLMTRARHFDDYPYAA